jgi:hypothetical protein
LFLFICRFDHFAGLCELLPTSIPILASVLQLFRGSALHAGAVESYVSNVLECPGLGEALAAYHELKGRHADIFR